MTSKPTPQPEALDVRRLTARQFQRFGIRRVAYVIKANLAEQEVLSVHAADGDLILYVRDQNVATELIARLNMIQFSVH